MRLPLALGSVIAALLVGRVAAAQATPVAAPPSAVAPEARGAKARAEPLPGAPTSEPLVRPLVELENAPLPPTKVVYVQYGVSVTAETVAAAGPICDNVAVPCIIGTGGGVAVRLGWRGMGAWYLGSAYELSKQDPNKLLRLAILQQARAEARYYFVSGRDTEPYLLSNLGVAGYGNEWAVDTWGPMGSLGIGVETQLSHRTVVGLALAYRLLYFRTFVDTTGAPRDAGVVQLIGLDFVLEQRDPIYTADLPSNR